MLMDKINVANGFQTAVNIAYDLNNDDKIRHFIPTQSSLDIIEDVLLSTAASATQRARILIGAYGRGKSHIVLVLLSLLMGKDGTLFSTLLAKMKKNNSALYDYAVEYMNSKRRLLPVVVRGSSTSLSSSFLGALQTTLNDENLMEVMPETHFQAAINTIEGWKESFPDTYKQLISKLPHSIDDFILSLKEYDVAAYGRFSTIYPQLTSGSVFNPFIGFDIAELYENVVKSVKIKGFDGIFVVYDEFSKYLESSIANATISDIKLLQDFAEKCDRSGAFQLHLLLICHKDIANYIDGYLPKEKVDGWRGVSGRFKHIHLHNNYAQMYEIISDVIDKDNKFWEKYKKDNAKRFDDLISRFTRNKLLDANNIAEVENAVFGCYPLHPVSTFILPRLSEKVAQNERTLFTFMSSDDKHTLSSFLSTAKDEYALLTPDYIYDYFEPLLRKEPYVSEEHKIYKLTANVLQKVEEGSLGSKILKTIALIYLVEQFEKLPPMVNIICDAFLDSVSDVKIINAALTELIEKDCIVYLKRSNNYLKIKESSGIDIPTEISKFIENNKAVLRVKDILNRSSFDSYLYPTRYNDDFEITRYFDSVFIDSTDFFETDNWERRILNTNADGVVYAIIPKSDTEIGQIKKMLSEKRCDSDRIVFILPNSHSDIEKMAFEYEAVKTLRASVESDELLSDEYDIYLDDLTEVLRTYTNSFTHPENGGAAYFYNGEECAIYRRSQLSEKLSEICEMIFNRTPIVNNESINKNILSTQTINSRKKLLAGLLAPELLPNLGLTGTGQDVSIMRSTLIQTGILTNSEHIPVLNLEPDQTNIREMLLVIKNFVHGAKNNGGSPFSSLYDILVLPKNGFGLKRGIIPIYLAVALRQDKQNLVIKKDSAEVRITPDLLSEINESPEGYSVILDDWNEDKAAYLTGLEKLFSKQVSEHEKAYNSFSYVLLAMNRWYMNLPKYAKELGKEYIGSGDFNNIPEHDLQFINGLKQTENNPREFLLEKVVKIFGKPENFGDILQFIREIKIEWDNAVPKLILTLISDVSILFAGNVRGASLTSAVKDWYESLSYHTIQHLFSGSENRILDLMASITNDESAFIQRLGKSLTSLRIEDWNADTITVFLEELQSFKKTIEKYDKNRQDSDTIGSNYYKISYEDENGNEVIKTFGKSEYSQKAKLLLNDLSNAIKEMGQSITEQEKRQVLIELLRNHC